MADQEKIAAHRARYMAEAKRMQTGVAFDLGNAPDGGSGTPKHLRVGINTALSDVGGLVTLLIRKGVFTEEEYVEALADAMEREAAGYEARLRRRFGARVTLGEAGFGADPE
jgi:hypothetical protein